MSKTCQEAIELMNMYLDGRLSGGQYQELAKHQAECEHCRKRMNYLRVISSEIRSDRPGTCAQKEAKPAGFGRLGRGFGAGSGGWLCAEHPAHAG